MFKTIIAERRNPYTAAASSWSCTLPKAPISSIEVRIAGTGGAGTVALANTMVSNVKLISEKDKYVDLSTVQLVRREGILEGIPRAITNADGAYSELLLAILAGKKKRDKQLMFDLTDCATRSLELTFDANLVGATRFAASNPFITVTCEAWEGPLPAEYLGYLKQWQVASITTGTGDYTIKDLPVEGKYDEIDVTASAATTLNEGLLELWAKNESILWHSELFRDSVNKMNYQRHLDTALTLNALIDLAMNDRFEYDYTQCPDTADMENVHLKVQRGGTTTTLVVCVGTLIPPS